MPTVEVKIIECPRDAWQGLKGHIPAYIKTDYLQALIAAGFKHIDAVSFVSPKAVPQMADSEEVLKELDPPDDVEIIGIVVNEKGAQRAIDTACVSIARWAPFSLTTIPIISTSSGGSSSFNTSSESAIWGTAFGDTNETASMCLNPALIKAFR